MQWLQGWGAWKHLGLSHPCNSSLLELGPQPTSQHFSKYTTQQAGPLRCSTMSSLPVLPFKSHLHCLSHLLRVHLKACASMICNDLRFPSATAVFTYNPCHSKAVRMCILDCLLQAHTRSLSRKHTTPHTISSRQLAHSPSQVSFVLD